MRLLVFGSTGQVARELQRIAPEARYLAREEADLTDPAACAAAIDGFDGDAVINAAAYTAVDKAETDEATATQVNGAAPAAMAKAARRRGLPFIHISTDYVFDGAGTRPWHPDDPPGPIGAYGRSKLAGEEGVLAAGGTFAILRTSWVFSAHGANFVKTMLRLGKTRESLSVVDDQTGGPTGAGDIASALVTIARNLLRSPQSSGIYHFSGAPDVTWAGFAQEIFRQSRLPTKVIGIPTIDYPTPAKRPAYSRLDCTSLRTVFGIARPDWRQSLTRVLQELGES
jgi:dTDP-4-dehydrorhamnose reductase